MTVTTYTELVTEVANFLNRSDLTAHIPSFISYGQDMINSDLAILQMENRDTVTLSTSTRLLDLPTGFKKMINFRLNTTPVTPLRFRLPGDLVNVRYDDSDTVKPRYYTIHDKIELNAIPDQGYEAEYHYVKKWSLSEANPTNWLLTNHPLIYLNAALIRSCVKTRDFGLRQIVKDDYQEIINGIKQNDRFARNAYNSTMRTGIDNLQTEGSSYEIDSDTY